MSTTTQTDCIVKTTLWAKAPGATFFRLMLTITPTSTFRDSNDKNLHIPERQMEVAIDQMQGWQRNGGMHNHRWKIVQQDINDSNQPPTVQYHGPGSYNEVPN